MERNLRMANKQNIKSYSSNKLKIIPLKYYQTYAKLKRYRIYISNSWADKNKINRNEKEAIKYLYNNGIAKIIYSNKYITIYGSTNKKKLLFIN
jgi:hypothetical protein